MISSSKRVNKGCRSNEIEVFNSFNMEDYLISAGRNRMTRSTALMTIVTMNIIINAQPDMTTGSPSLRYRIQYFVIAGTVAVHTSPTQLTTLVFRILTRYRRKAESIIQDTGSASCSWPQVSFHGLLLYIDQSH